MNLLEQANRYNIWWRARPSLSPVGSIPLNEELGRQTADYFEATPHNPNDLRVRQAYDAMKRDIKSQWTYASRVMGIQFIPTRGDPYSSSQDMIDDVTNNHRLRIFTGGTMPPDHPLAAIDPDTGLSYNVMFRGVHDLFGHAAHGNQFGPIGERRAFAAHAQMFQTKAIPALAFETHAQNSWFNFGKHIRNAGRFIAPERRPFPPQKANVLPERYYRF